QPYGLWRLNEAQKVGRLFIVEGESDCWTLWLHGEPALGIPGNTSANVLLAEHLEQVDEVYIVRENDQGGKTFLDLVPKRLKTLDYRGAVYALALPAEVKDVNDLHCAGPEQFKERWDEVVRLARRLDKGDSWEGDGDGEDGPAKKERRHSDPPVHGQHRGDDAALHLTDLGNARRVGDRHGLDLRKCHPLKAWRVGTGRTVAPSQ